MQIELDREVKAEQNVEPGSYWLIYPKNDPEVVEEFMKIWNWERSDELVEKLTKNLDFLQPVNLNALKLITPDEEEKFGSKETISFNYFDIVNYLKPKETVDEKILGFMPKIKARYYSLASDLVNTNSFSTCFTVEVHEQDDIFEKGNKVIKKGVCSHYLERLADVKTEFELKFNKISQFKTSSEELESKVPIIFISHGTAIAPFLSVLESFKRMLKNSESKSIGDIDIYYGIRNKNHDFLFEKEITELFDYFKESNPEGNFTVHVCESRPGNTSI